MRKNKILLYVLLLFNTSIFAQKEVRYRFKDFKSTKTLIGKKRHTDMLMNPGNLNLFDTLLFCRNFQCSPNYTVIDLNSGNKVNTFGTTGRGPGEILHPFGYQIDRSKETILVNDPTKREILKFSISKIVEKAANPYIGSIKVKERYTRMCLTQNGLICTLLSNPNYLSHCVVDTFSGKTERYFGRYPSLKIDYRPEMAVNLFSKTFGSHDDDSNVYAEGYCDINRIDVYKDEKLQVIIKGKENEKLIYTFINNRPIVTDENNYCFIQVDIVGDMVFASYSGNSRRGDDVRKVINRILVFDFEGTPVEMFIMEPAVNFLTIDCENKIIWGVNNVYEPTLYKFQY